jgi:endonuclease/exonuclease/phosphatase family metal-dependent hydrolase
MHAASVASRRGRLAMKSLVTAIFVSLCNASIASSTEPQPLRVLSYNIHHGEGTDGRIDLLRIAKVIKAASPDIALLQEVDRHVPRSGNIDQASELGKATGMDVAFGANLTIANGSYGNAILSRFPLSNSANIRLPGSQQAEPRGVLGADVTLPDSFGATTCRILVTHLDHLPPDTDRLRAIEEINRWAKQDRRLVVIGGDFNATSRSAVMNRFRDTWTLVGKGEYPTFPAATPQRQIDFIGYRSPAPVSVGDVLVLDEAVASDHRPILASLSICR